MTELVVFKQGDPVRNINPNSSYFGLTGTFQRQLEWIFQSVGDLLEPACDVAYPGHHGPYGYPYIAQRMTDLELVEQEEETVENEQAV